MNTSTDFTFIHAADLHLDTPFSGLGRVAPEIAASLQDASLEAFDALIDLTLQEQARFLLIAGDIYDGQERGIRAQLRFLKGLERLSRAGVRTFVIHGNHDPLAGWSAIRNWPEGVHCFGAESVETVSVEDEGDRLATIYGISYATPAVQENLALRFRRQEAPGLHIGLLHCNAGHSPEHGNYAPCTLDDLRAGGLDYWALGHVHKRQILHEEAPWVVYPGNIQGRSPKPSEMEPKGALVVRVRQGRVQPPTFAPLDRVRFAPLEVDITGLEDLPALTRRLQELAEEARAAHAGRAVILRATLTGRGDVHSDLERPEALEALLRSLREGAEGLAPWLWWESLRDETHALLDREAIRQRKDFSAELLAMAEAIAADPDRLAAFGDHHAQPPDRFARLAGDDADWAKLLAEAEELALGLLE